MRKRGNIRLAVSIFMAIVVALFLPVVSIAGSLEPPSGTSVSTMKTLDQIPPTWSQRLQCDTTACPRFELVFPNICGLRCITWGGVLDKETGLVWEQSPDTALYTWNDALRHCIKLNKGDRMGWHLPTIEQLTSLVDISALPTGHPFTGVPLNDFWSPTTDFWSATTSDEYPRAAYVLSLTRVHLPIWYDKPNEIRAWCVRGGQGVDKNQ